MRHMRHELDAVHWRTKQEIKKKKKKTKIEEKKKMKKK